MGGKAKLPPSYGRKPGRLGVQGRSPWPRQFFGERGDHKVRFTFANRVANPVGVVAQCLLGHNSDLRYPGAYT